MSETAQQIAQREGRIAARRKRVQERLASLQEGLAPGSKQIESIQELSKSRHQVVESKKALFALKLAAWQEITATRLKTDVFENQHRFEEENTRQVLRAQLLAEAEQSVKDNAVACEKWEKLLSQDIPQELYEDIQSQVKLCEAIIVAKDDVIADIQAELKRKDEDYVKLLKMQSLDVDNILMQMTRQATEMQNSVNEELAAIERAFELERQNLLESNQKELFSLLEIRSKEEIDFLETHLQRIDEMQQSLDQLRLDDTEEYHNLKTKLETDIATLEQHLERMQATYQLNTEKLEYNYRVLKEREMENQSTIHQQKRKVSKLHDVLSSLKQRYVRMEAKFVDENEKLTVEYCRVTDQFKELQAKRIRFEEIDTRTYRKMWDMHIAEATRILEQLTAADRILHEQQLGLQWTAKQIKLPKPPLQLGNPSQCSQSQQLMAQTTNALEDEKRDQDLNEVAELLTDERVAYTLSILMEEANFLSESKILDVLSVPVNASGNAKLSNIIKALGIKDRQSLEILCEALRLDTAGDEQDALVAPSEVIDKLKAFVTLMKVTSNVGPSEEIKTKTTRTKTPCHRSDVHVRDYWDQVSHMGANASDCDLWVALEAQLKHHHVVLQGRAATMEAIEELKGRNEALRATLKGQLSTKKNAAFQVPPTALMAAIDIA